MELDDFLDQLAIMSATGEQISHIEHIASQSPKYGNIEQPLPPCIEEALKKECLWPLFNHQSEAVNHARKGLNVIISTPSSSGKSLAYQIPVVESVISKDFSRSLCIFPTKALARDQWLSFNRLAAHKGLSNLNTCVYDGDTPFDERSDIRQKVNILITNPDMLHYSILPRHGQWSRFFSGLKFVILDEAHIYRGVFGSNVSLIMRRLRRICSYYGSRPVFVMCSATIANPEERSTGLTGLNFQVVTKNGAPAGERDFVFWNPPVVDAEKGNRKSSNAETAMLLAELVSHEIKSLAFARTRRLTELIYTYTRDRLKKTSPKHALKVKPYRAGYMPEVRRQIEEDLISDKLKGVVATNALELGINIGKLDATLLAGYPGTISSTWQQAGRSGRGGRKSITIMVGRADPLDQYLMRNPESFFSKHYENALINPENPYILKNHLLCAAWEYPLKKTDNVYFGKSFESSIHMLEAEKHLKKRGERWYVSTSIDYPAKTIDIRSAFGSSINVVDIDSGFLIDTVERSTAVFQAHPGAVYLNQGDSYLIQELDLDGNIATAKAADVPYYTVADDITSLQILSEQQYRTVGSSEVLLGEVEVTTSVIAFKRKEQFSEKIIGREALDLPEEIFKTVSFWFGLPTGLKSEIVKGGFDLEGGLHAVEHAVISILPLFAMCDRNDIGGVSTSMHPDTGQPQIFVYDAYPGGIGIAEKGFEKITCLWESTIKLISSCFCEDGCPSCIQSPKCGNNNQPLDKKAAIFILKRLLY